MRGEILLYQGDFVDEVGYVLKGRGNAVYYSQNGEQTWLYAYKPGDFFGHTSVLTGEALAAEVAADSSLDVVYFKRRFIEERMAQDPELATLLARDLAMRLTVMTSSLVQNLTLTTRGRICAELLARSQPIGRNPDRRIIRPSPVFTDLAARLNTTRETVSRTVSDLCEKGLTERETGAILILKPDLVKAEVTKGALSKQR